jgi:hypothetical protein
VIRRSGFNIGGIVMGIRLLDRVVAGALAATLALASPALARGSGGGMGGGGGGARGNMGGGMHAMGTVGMGNGMHTMGAAMHSGGPTQLAAMGTAPHWSGRSFAGAPATHAAFSPRFGFHNHFFHHHRFHGFAFFGAPFFYAGYDSCWRRYWTAYGLQWVNVCGNYTY